MTLRLTDYVRVYDDVLSPALCADMIEGFEANQSSSLRRSQDTLSFDELVIDARPEWIEFSLALERAKDEAFERYKTECPGRFPSAWDHEAFRIKRYQPDMNDRFENHVDAYDLTSSKRFLVCFWYLNDVPNGGETQFPLLRTRVRARAGRAIVFPPFWMFEHAGLRPLEIPKYIVSTYLLFAR